jgi:hypothetical protein
MAEKAPGVLSNCKTFSCYKKSSEEMMVASP